MVRYLLQISPNLPTQRHYILLSALGHDLARCNIWTTKASTADGLWLRALHTVNPTIRSRLPKKDSGQG